MAAITCEDMEMFVEYILEDSYKLNEEIMAEEQNESSQYVSYAD